MKALISKPESEPNRATGGNSTSPFSPWQREYFYEQPGSTTRTATIYSAGQDRKVGTADDKGNWDNPQN